MRARGYWARVARVQRTYTVSPVMGRINLRTLHIAPNFASCATRARGERMQTPTSGAAVRVLCYGDSLTAGYTALTKYTGEYAPWATHLGDALGLPVDHVGMCGWTTEQMVDGLDGEANVDVCDVAHRGLRRLLEEGGYTHVRQQWLPVFCAQPAAQSPALLELPCRLHRAALWA